MFVSLYVYFGLHKLLIFDFFQKKQRKKTREKISDMKTTRFRQR